MKIVVRPPKKFSTVRTQANSLFFYTNKRIFNFFAPQIFRWGYLQSVFSKVLCIVQSLHEVVLIFPHLKVHDCAGRLAPGPVHHLPG